METAIHHRDLAIHLLVELGASLDIGIQESYEGWAAKASLLEAVEATVKKIDKEVEDLQRPESADSDHGDQPEWKAWIIKSNRAIKDFRKKQKGGKQDNNRINELTRMRDYLGEVLGLLKEKKAKTWNQLHPDAARKEDDEDANKKQKPESPFFGHLTSGWRSEPVPQEKAPLYEELYEACWNGDDNKIRELCLPTPEGTARKVAPIQIACETTEGGEPCLGSAACQHSRYHLQITPRCMLQFIVATGRQRRPSWRLLPLKKGKSPMLPLPPWLLTRWTY